jgi:hypothetical protein
MRLLLHETGFDLPTVCTPPVTVTMPVELRRQELSLKEQEQTHAEIAARRSRRWNPLIIAIVGATIAALGSIAVSWWNGRTAQQAELIKAESARILEMIKTGDAEKAKENLRFLLATGLITDPTAATVRTYLKQQPPGQGPVLPSLANLPTLTQPAGPNVEASQMHLFPCPGDLSQTMYYIYEYTARKPGVPNFRVVAPGIWTGIGPDLSTAEEAEKIALQACKGEKIGG